MRMISRSRLSSKRSGSGALSMTHSNSAAKRVANNRSLTAGHTTSMPVALRFDEIRHDGEIKIQHSPLTWAATQGHAVVHFARVDHDDVASVRLDIADTAPRAMRP